MVAKIESGKSIAGALNYNERKVNKEKARLIKAPGFPKEHLRLTFGDKLFRLQDLAGRNSRTKTNTVHISLNFDVSEKIAEDKLSAIAETYMSGIGFGNQPFLVYEHLDAGHPHIHILTTNIQANGERISLHNIGRERSEPCRKAIEDRFGLVRAESHSQQSKTEQFELRKLQYGQLDSRRAITNIVNAVIRNYRFGSLPEFNTILKEYNVLADRGNKGSTMYEKSGLRYWITDNDGNRTGVPLKASSLYGRPTLRLLTDRFLLNDVLRKPFKPVVRQKIDNALMRTRSLEGFKRNLGEKGIILTPSINEEGRIYGVTFLDKESKCVFKGSDLGKAYSAMSITQRLAEQPAEKTGATHQLHAERSGAPYEFTQSGAGKSSGDPSLLAQLFEPERDQAGNNRPIHRRRKKKKKGLNL